MEKLKLNYSNDIPLPNNFLVEQAVLNILLTNPNLINNILSLLKLNTFYYESHKIVYSALIELVEKNKKINLTLLITYLQDNNKLKEIGGLETIIKIINRYENFYDLENYIKILNEKYIRRLIIEMGREIITLGYLNNIALEDIIERIENYIFNLNLQKSKNKLYSTVEVLDEIFQEIKFKINNDENNGLKTSFKDLDVILQGLQKSDLIVVAGRPSMGKTAFALNLGKKIVENYNLPLIIFSLEMSRQQIIYRFIASDSKINTNRLKTTKMTSLEWKRLSESMLHLSKLPIFIDDNPNLTLSDIRLKLTRILTEKKEIGLIIIDYLQLMKLNNNLENRVQEISYITRNLKILAKEFEIPIVILSQLSRSVESRVNKRPLLSDLRESGCLAKNKIFKNLYSWNLDKIIKNESINFNFKGIKPTYLLTFDNSLKIQLTANHKILSKNGWIKIFQITKMTELYFLTNNKEFKAVYSFKKLINLEYKGLQKVYDKTIKFFHNYIEDNLILHNSIEQDSDIVIMLYRDDYYTEKNNQNTITEFIVAKHRNGPVGTARLFFNSEFTSFENL